MKQDDWLGGLGRTLGELRRYLGLSRGARSRRIEDESGLAEFIDSRASHVGQSSLYGYLKTRAGTRFPQLFEHPDFVDSINIAKWHVWAACVSDLAVFAGGLLASGGVAAARVSDIMESVIDGVLDGAGEPAEAGADFGAATQAVRDRIRACEWSAVADDESAFTESPASLVRWAPVVDELKQFDTEIVRNSIRFRWIEVRRKLRSDLHAAAFSQSGP